MSASHSCQILCFPHSPHCQLCLPSSIPSLAGQSSSLADLVNSVQQASHPCSQAAGGQLHPELPLHPALLSLSLTHCEAISPGYCINPASGHCVNQLKEICGCLIKNPRYEANELPKLIQSSSHPSMAVFLTQQSVILTQPRDGKIILKKEALEVSGTSVASHATQVIEAKTGVKIEESDLKAAHFLPN